MKSGDKSQRADSPDSEKSGETQRAVSPDSEKSGDKIQRAVSPDSDTNHRLDQLERKVDLILEALKALGRPAGNAPF